MASMPHSLFAAAIGGDSFLASASHLLMAEGVTRGHNTGVKPWQAPVAHFLSQQDSNIWIAPSVADFWV
mgnify:CR=1 FL=1